ncbi:hypothetical protein F5887DRAFT_1075265 [Amanita rubescens]|nr:hypothetical protein F5887DRAFT_1075265 [Amanita rubescens]
MLARSSHALNHLRVLNTLLSPKQFTQPYDTQIPEYLFHNGLYSLISKAIRAIPVESKSSPALPMLVELVKNVLSVPQTSHPQTVCQVVTNLVTIPLLPYRLPLKSLGSFSASMLFSDLNVVSPHLVTPIVESLDESSRIHLLSNLVSFVPPRYPSLSKEAISAYLQLLTALLNSLPISSAAAPQRVSHASEGDDSDSEAPAHVLAMPSTPHPALDPRTLKRLSTLPEPPFIPSLLGLTKTYPSIQLHLITFLLALNAVWPSRKDQVLGAASIYATRGGDDSPGSILDQANADAWPPLIFLADLYNQMLLTMGDDEFFGLVVILVGARSAGSAATVGGEATTAGGAITAARGEFERLGGVLCDCRPNIFFRQLRNPLAV